MEKTEWYKALFENYGQRYEHEIFTKGTLSECDFIEQEINYNKKISILDVGCGTGRHSIELTKRGYRLTGIDLSESMLTVARENAKAQQCKVQFLQADARHLVYTRQFDVAIMLCEGGFPLMETDEMNFQILKNVTKALTENGKFIFTTLNGLFALYNSVEKFCAAANPDGNTRYHSNTFDLMTFRDYNTTEITDDSGNKIILNCNERYYVPSEITWLLKTLGFKTIDIYAANIGAFSREKPLTINDFEMLVIASL